MFLWFYHSFLCGTSFTFHARAPLAWEDSCCTHYHSAIVKEMLWPVWKSFNQSKWSWVELSPGCSNGRAASSFPREEASTSLLEVTRWCHKLVNILMTLLNALLLARHLSVRNPNGLVHLLYKLVRHNNINWSTWNRRGRITISAFAGGMLYVSVYMCFSAERVCAIVSRQEA